MITIIVRINATAKILPKIIKIFIALDKSSPDDELPIPFFGKKDIYLLNGSKVTYKFLIKSLLITVVLEEELNFKEQVPFKKSLM